MTCRKKGVGSYWAGGAGGPGLWTRLFTSPVGTDGNDSEEEDNDGNNSNDNNNKPQRRRQQQQQQRRRPS